MEENFYELSNSVTDTVKSVYDEMYFAFDLNIKYVGNAKLKNVINVRKANGLMEHLTGHNIIIEINEEIVDAVGEDILRIIAHQELSRIETSLDTGKIKVNQLKLKTSISTIKKYDVDVVAEANETILQYIEQQKDNKNE